MKRRCVRCLMTPAAMVLIACLGDAAQLAGAQTETPGAEHAPVAHSMAELRPGRVVLLREGSVLTQTTGVLRRNADGQWVFVITMPDVQKQQIELILLPNSTLEEMQRIAESIEDRELAFETTGEVFVYQNRNYLLPTHAPHLIETRNVVEPEPAQSQPADEATTPDDEADVAEEDDSIESIMQRLEERSGPIARSSADDRPATSQPIGQMAAANNSTLREGMTLVDRRGHITRGSQGAWMFVFDADAEGLADPPVRILPCMMLERMQEYARLRSNIAPMLLSGRVFEYQGRRYVLPTLYRIPRTRTPMTP